MPNNAPEVIFYDIERGELNSVAVGLLEKAYASGKRCLFFSSSAERLKVVDKTLWTFSTNAFVPHGDRSVGFCEQQPIYLTDLVENPNKAEILILLDSFDCQAWSDHSFERIMLLQEQGNDPNSTNDLILDLQKKFKNVVYWKQVQKKWTKIA
ncbi:MAG: DNA polymerase III subunit chi [Holosporaceae bacterium]|jgi:DNA polymerase-3 subunit chi|nr:DNA polymerase III subunit chi [Holosporaceae bacterium]